MQFKIEELQEIEIEMLQEVVAICSKYDINYYLAYGSLLGAIRHKGPIPWDCDVDIKVPINHLDKFIKNVRENLSDKFYLDYHDVNENYPVLLPRIGLKGYNTKVLHLDIFILIGAPSNRYKQYIFKTTARFYRTVFMFKNFNPIYFGRFNFKRKFFIPIIKAFLLPFSKKFIIKRFQLLCNTYSLKEADFMVNAQFGYKMKEFISPSIYGEGSIAEFQGLMVRVPERYSEYLEVFYDDYMELPSEKERTIKPFYEIDEI